MTPELPSQRQLILRINELFHDMEGEDYSHVHPEIFEQEQARWDRIAAELMQQHHHPMTIADIGAGTGFVGERFIPFLQGGDTFVCADISATMLKLAQEKLQSKTGATIRTLKMTDEAIALETESVDIVTMNSVLHHIPDSHRFLEECIRILKPGGFLCIGHEPNARFVRSRFLRGQASLLHHLTPKRIAARILRLLHLYDRIVPASHDPFLVRLNAALVAEGLIASPLTRADISPLIDVHSPTAGGLRIDEGFDPVTLLTPWESEMKVIRVDTYNHLGKLSGTVPWFTPYETFLRQLFPKKGATFFLIAKKMARSRLVTEQRVPSAE